MSAITFSVAPALLNECDEDDGVGDDDDDEREEVDHDGAEDDVGRALRVAGERVEDDALRVPGEVRVNLDVENVDLE